MTEKTPRSELALSSEQAWSTLFEQPVPEFYKKISARMMADSIGSAYANSHILFYYSNSLRDIWKKFPSSEIDKKNIFPLKFTEGTEPYILLDLTFFGDHHPEAIEILDKQMLAKLEQQLRKDRVLKENGILAGQVLFTYEPRLLKVKDGGKAIGIGVVDADTNDPLGIIFCQEAMLPYRRTGYTGKGNRKRKPKEVTVREPVPQPQVI